MGACMERAMERDEAARERLMRRLDGFLTRDRYRALFGLEAKEAA